MKESIQGFRGVTACPCVCFRSWWCVRLPGRRHGLGSLIHWPGTGLRVPGHLLLLSADLDHLSHRAPLQHSRAALVQGAFGIGGIASQRTPPSQRPQQWVRSSGQRAHRPRSPCTGHRPKAEVLLCPWGSELCDLQCQAAKQGGMELPNWALRGSNSEL